MTMEERLRKLADLLEKHHHDVADSWPEYLRKLARTLEKKYGRTLQSTESDDDSWKPTPSAPAANVYRFPNRGRFRTIYPAEIKKGDEHRSMEGGDEQ